MSPRTGFHPLPVARVDRLTEDSAAVTFRVPPELREKFAFAPGQSVTIRRGAQRRCASASGRWPTVRSPAGWCARSGPVT